MTFVADPLTDSQLRIALANVEKRAVFRGRPFVVDVMYWKSAEDKPVRKLLLDPLRRGEKLKVVSEACQRMIDVLEFREGR